MSSIIITSAPPFPTEAPEWVRRKWIGIKIPILDPSSIVIPVGARRLQDDSSYNTKPHQAIEALQQKCPDAAAWIKKNVDLGEILYLCFKKEICKKIE